MNRSKKVCTNQLVLNQKSFELTSLFYSFYIKKTEGSEYCCFSNQINMILHVLRLAASLAAVCRTISNQSQFRSRPHKSCNPSNFFGTVTRMCGEVHFVFVWLSYCQVTDKKLKLSPLPPQKITQIRRTKV